MKFTLSWLKDYLDTEASLDDVVETMTMAGLEVEHVDNPRQKLSAFSIAHVRDAVPHPDADKLKVCQVLTKDGEKTIICGAPNARKGMTAVYAPVGSFIPGTGITLSKAKIRGVASEGMLCSERELELGEDHDGILDLEDDFPVGMPAVEALGLDDPVIDFEVTPNRPDWLGVEGIARDMAAAGLGNFISRPVPKFETTFPCPVRVETRAPEACPVFMGRLIKGVKNGPSPDWLQKRLKAIGLRPINRLVDVTNYFSYDRARPLHVYDAEKLTGPVQVRLGDGKMSFEALDGKTYTPTHNMCVIADETRILGLGGVMGGSFSGCTEETRHVFLESAWFTPATTARTGRETGIVSDSRYRFERGVDPRHLKDDLDRATALILELCGGEASEDVQAGTPPSPLPALVFDLHEITRLTGLNVKPETAQSMLNSLGFSCVQEEDNKYLVTPPSWRRDVETSADLVEEIARLTGYDDLPATSLPHAKLPQPAYSFQQNRARLARRVLASRGYLETITWSFCHQDHAIAFGGGKESLHLANPLASEFNVMRPSPLIELARSVQKASDQGRTLTALGEVGPVYHSAEPEGQSHVVSAVRSMERPRHWSPSPQPDIFTMKADILAVLDALDAPVNSLQLSQPARNWWHPGRSAVLSLGPQNKIAEFGELHPQALKVLGVENPLLAFEIFLDALPSPKTKKTARPPFENLDLMPVHRDFAFVLSKDISVDKLVGAIRKADKNLITHVHVFDLYEGKHIEAGHISVALEVGFQPKEKTMNEEEIGNLSQKIIESVQKTTGAFLRH